MSKVFRIKPTFCEHLLIVPRWKKPDWNYKNNARLFRFGFTVWFSSYPSALLHVVSIANFVASKISCSVFETGISFRLVFPTFESFFDFIFPGLSAIKLWTSGRTWCKITSRRSRRLIGQFSLSLFMFQIWYLRKWIITSIVQNLHMRVTRFKSLWVSGIILYYIILYYIILYYIILYYIICILLCL